MNCLALDKNKKHEIDIVVDRIVVNKELGNRLPDSIETALQLGDGLVQVWKSLPVPDAREKICGQREIRKASP